MAGYVPDLPKLTLWDLGDQALTWTSIADLPAYTELDVEVRHNDTGPWSATFPKTYSADLIDTAEYVTVDWRGKRLMTGRVLQLDELVDEDGNPTIKASGLDALCFLGDTVAYPQPNNTLQQQVPQVGGTPPIRTATDAAILRVVRDNLLTRKSYSYVQVAGDQGIGSVVSIRPAFQNILDLALKKAKRGGIGVRGTLLAGNTLVMDLSATTTQLWFWCYQSADVSQRVQFNEDDGTISEWTLTRTAPTATRAIVSGAAGAYAATVRDDPYWTPPHREIFVQGPDSADGPELVEAGDEALDEGAGSVNLKATVAETQATQAFRDYWVGDTASMRVGGHSYTAPITAIGVHVESGSGPVVTPVFGDPDGFDPSSQQAAALRRLRRVVRGSLPPIQT